MAFKIDVEEEEDVEIKGALVEVNGDSITVLTERDRRLTMSIDDATKIELDDDVLGRPSDIHVGEKVEVDYDPKTNEALLIETDK